MPIAESRRTRVLPLFQWVHGVPAVLVVVAHAAAEDDAGATWRQRQRVPRTDLSGAERSAGVGETYAPAASASGTHSGNAARDGDVHLPRARMLTHTFYG
jgi:hypothetical protein